MTDLSASSSISPDTSPIIYTFNDPRTLSQALWHFVLLRILVFFAQGSLLSSRHISKKRFIVSITLFIFLPTFELSQILCRLVLCIHQACTKPWPTNKSSYITYLICATLGLRAFNSLDLEKSPDKGTATGLLSAPFDDFTHERCACTTRFCKKWTRPYLASILTHCLTIVYCLVTLSLYIRRRSQTPTKLAQQLLTGTPAGSKETKMYANAFATIGGFDELNAIWAFAGITASCSALYLKLVPSIWLRKSLDSSKPIRDPALHFRSIRHSSMDVRIELPLAALLYISLTIPTWIRTLTLVSTSNPFNLWMFRFSQTFGIFYALIVHVLYLTDKKFLGKWEVTPTGLFVAWVFGVTQDPVVHAVKDLWALHNCTHPGVIVTGSDVVKACRNPLLLWEDPWLKTIWRFVF